MLLDETRVRQVLFNLIGNAIKFTNMGWVEIDVSSQSCREDPTKVLLTIEVNDTGIGIPQDQQHKIFESFEQQDGQSTRKYGGTGLGLSISQRLIRMMGGEISVRSKPNVGSTFSIVLKEIEVVDEASVEAREHDEEYKHIKFEPATVLVVDDVESNRMLIKSALEGSGVRVVEAVNGNQAVMMCGGLEPDIVLMDIRMPVMGGVEATLKIKTYPKLSNIPIIAVTASMSIDEKDNNAALKQYEKETQRELFDGYIRKPLLISELYTMLKRFLPYTPAHDNGSIPSKESVEEGLHLQKRVVQEIEERVVPLWERAFEGGMFDDILLFADALLEIGKKEEVDTLISLAKQIKGAVESFDVDAIERHLQSFSDMLEKEKTKDANG